MSKSIQKVIKVGSSAAVTIPAKEVKRLGLQSGDQVEVSFKSVNGQLSENDIVMKEARALLDEYRQDFENLAQR